MRSFKLPTALGVLVLAVFVAACGGSEQPDPQQAFLQSMVPHHRSAVDMAEVAETEAQTEFVKNLASEITRTQTEEIGQMGQIHRRMFDAPLKPDMGAHMALGLSAQQAGMNHMDGANTIRGKKPFDRAFVDEMIPHHQGAMRMAEAVLAKTDDPRLRSLGEGIIAAQRKEVGEMKRFREREYGGARAAATENDGSRADG
ncbi:MAG: hypothetical protein AVDCRST_MAG17-858 [uncultured Solirubrobacterales bacterium]|uniref:DUF305 domain-containing protein n=1 Tax=uncultured Solirubrobacterales bacterium TaxID=768556 RepID=A0A6J4SFX2_9ACTN|nr:MAG: hypothetical protein AVDCRST_MAG17-858 [uncultured Solirubrobacterales bacterium]